MQQRAGLLFLSLKTKKILLILESQSWTVPTFARSQSLLEDVKPLLDKFKSGKIVPIELYISEDKGFEYGTYTCLTDNEFICDNIGTYAWCELNNLPKQLHTGLKTTLNNQIIKTKIETILELSYADIKKP